MYAEDIDLSGLTYKEARSKVEDRIAELRGRSINLTSINDRVTTVTAGDFGIKWSNSDILLEAIGLGKRGNVIARYKANKDLEVEHKVYDINITADKSYVKNVIQAESDACGSDAKDATMTRENGVFHITEGQEGYGIDVDASVEAVMNRMDNWDKNDCTIELVSGMIQPKGTAADLEKIQDLLGHFSTSFSSALIFVPAIFPAAACRRLFARRNNANPRSRTSAIRQSKKKIITMISDVVSSPSQTSITTRVATFSRFSMTFVVTDVI